MREREDKIEARYIALEMMNEMSTANFLDSNSFRNKLCARRIKDSFLYGGGVYSSKFAETSIYNIYFN